MRKKNLKRGAAIELALFILLTVILAGSLLVANAITATKYSNKAFVSLTEKARIEESANGAVLAYLQGKDLSSWQGENSDYNDLNFSITESEENDKIIVTLEITEKSSAKGLLSARFLKSGANQLIVISWEY